MESKITPSKMAEYFCKMNFDEQALFLKSIGEYMEKNCVDGIHFFNIITSCIVESEYCTDKAIEVMKILGKYSEQY